MTRAVKARTNGRDPKIEDELTNRYHVDWEFRAAVPTSEFDIEESLKNNARFVPLDEDTVDAYQEAVERGDVFPGIVARRPGRAAGARLVSVDGNHRLVAHARAGRPIDLYEVARTTKPQLVQLMTYGLNTRHGRGTSEAERIAHAMYLVDNGADQTTAAREVNVPLRLVKRAVERGRADRRAKEVGIPPAEWDSLTSAVKQRLLNVSTDEGFRGAVHLVYAAKIGVNEAFDLVTMLNQTKSAERQRQMLALQAQQYKEQTQSNAGGVLSTAGRRAMTPKSRISMVMSHLVALPEDVSAVAQLYGPAERADARKQIMAASQQLRKIAEALRQ